ncbi:MAG TPA: CHAP domain-containing protein, partial [Opitutales bacterium]|nr:CHAP domain-containing protein [Opitutales bacterium]
GDTPQSLAQTYGSSAQEIISFNDAELSGLVPGEQIVIPGGHQAASLTVSYGTYGGLAAYGSNGYDFGFCTYWVALRRQQVGKPLPSNLGNAATWGYLAKAYGLPTGNIPRQYAAAVTSTIGDGHVIFVESVNPDGSINISEMNNVGWDVVDHRTIPAAEAAGFTYIY